MTSHWNTIENPLDIKKEATRDGFGRALLRLGKQQQNIVVLTADLSESLRVQEFATAFPNRFIECGVAEQNMLGIAAGLALSGKIPFVCSYAVFSPGRNWDQLRVSVAYSNANVKIVGGHTGLSVGPDGATHQALEDLAITQVLPNLTVLSPADSLQAEEAVHAATAHVGPVYLRIAREPTPILSTPTTPFKLGKLQEVATGEHVTLVSTGPLLYEVLLARQHLLNQGIQAQVLNVHTLKPFDTQGLLSHCQKTGCVVSIEDHQVIGGLGSTIAQTLASHLPLPMGFIGVHDQFGQSGTPKQLYEHYGMTARHIALAARKVITKKNHGSLVQY